MATDATIAAPPADAPAVAAAPVAAAPAKPAAPTPKAEAAKNGGKQAKAGKGGKQAKPGKGSKNGEEGSGADGAGPNVAAHPRAARAVARAKSWGGLAGFVFGGYVSLATNTLAGAALRALVAGVVCYVAVWAGAVFLWRRLVMIEIKGREQQLVAAANAASARRELPSGRPERPSTRSAS